MNSDTPSQSTAARVRHHLRLGWIGLLVFATLGTVLEALHGWKSAAYLGVGQETRRLMWTLAHAHGIGLSLVHIAYAATLSAAFSVLRPRLVRASHLLDASTLLVPLGFFLGGVATYESDPGVGVFLVPVGAVLFWVGALLTALELSELGSPAPAQGPTPEPAAEASSAGAADNAGAGTEP